jgi:hypothetical protein
MGRIAGPFDSPPIKDLIVSPLGLVPKKEPGQFRVIHNLSYPKGNSVNSHIDPYFTTVQYETLDHCVDIIQSIGKNCLVAKADLKDAFRIMPVHPKDHRLLGFMYNNQFYYDRCLPMGCSTSCQTFESLSNAIQWICKSKLDIVHMSHILDDFIFFSPSSSNQCTQSLRTFLALCQRVGLPVSEAKTVWPACLVQLHGLEVDTVKMELRLPMDKLSDLKKQVATMYRRKKVTLRELQSLLGSLNFACRAVVPGRPFRRRLIDLTVGVQKPSHFIRLTVEARKDLAVWQTFLQSFNGRCLCLPSTLSCSDTIKLQSDASGFAYASVFGDRWFQGQFPQDWRHVNIAIKEFLPIVLSIRKWGPILANNRILFKTDNESIVFAINKQSCKNSQLMNMVRQLVVAAMTFNIDFRAAHIPGKLNLVPDFLSRLQEAKARRIQPGLHRVPEIIPQDWLPWSQ